MEDASLTWQPLAQAERKACSSGEIVSSDRGQMIEEKNRHLHPGDITRNNPPLKKIWGSQKIRLRRGGTGHLIILSQVVEGFGVCSVLGTA